MKIACIGYMPEYEHKNVVDIAFNSNKSILEYDLLIIDFDSLNFKYNSNEYYLGERLLDDYDSVSIRKDMKRRKNEILEFLESGKNIIVILSKKDYCYYYTGKSEFSGTGRNTRKTDYVSKICLNDIFPNYPSTIEGTGNGIQIVDTKYSDFFAKYDGCFRYKAYTENISNNKILNIKGTRKTISFYEEYGNGIVLYLPEPTFEHLDKSASTKELNFLKDIENLLKDLKNSKVSPLPEWSNNYKLPNEQNIINNLNEIDKKIAKLKKEKEEEKTKLKELQNEKRLFTACDNELEVCVKDILEKIGFSILKFGGNEEDIIAEYNNKTFIVEVKGLDKSAAEKNVAQTTKWLANYFVETEKKAKGILIVNGFKKKILEERPEIFPNQMLRYSIQQEICLLSTIQLLNIYYAVQANPNDKEKIIDSLLKTKGVFSGYEDWQLTLTKDSKE